MANANIVPPNAENLVFAVDTVRFFLKKQHPHLPFELIRTDIVKNVNCYRPHVRGLFSDNIEEVLKEIDKRQLILVRSDFLDIQNKDGINRSSLIDYCRSLWNDNVDESIKAGNFLTYCARVASMASLFYANGCIEALDVGIDRIKSSFPDDPEKCKLVSENIENAASKFVSELAEKVPFFLFRREPDFSSGTEDSSSSSTATSDSDSDESLTSLTLRLNASDDVESSSTGNESVESTSSAATAESSKSSEGSIQNPTVSSSSTSRISEALKFEVDMSSRIERYFKGVESEPTIIHTHLPEPPSRKTSLGKRSSPRKESPSDTAEEDSDAEVKKPKFGSSKPDDDKNE